MKRKLKNNFNSKILLFGEYSLMHNSMALSIPFEAFEGSLTFKPKSLNAEQAVESNQHLRTYAEFLRTMVDENKFSFTFDIDQLEKDIDQNIVFDSTIPQGYGVGSSGALVAALYDHYVLDKIPNDRELTGVEMVRLKESLAEMESYFHGKSSGLDPLICYMKKPVLINENTDLNAVGMPNENSQGKGAIFLINTGQTGETQPLVNLFMEKCKEEGFLHVVKNEMIPINNNCIKSFLKGEVKEMFSNLKSLSGVLLNYLSPMIPKRFRNLWLKGIETEAYYLKLCGSGGGGFILGFTEDIEKAKQELGDQEIEVIHRF